MMDEEGKFTIVKSRTENAVINTKGEVGGLLELPEQGLLAGGKLRVEPAVELVPRFTAFLKVRLAVVFHKQTLQNVVI